jgi:ParG
VSPIPEEKIKRMNLNVEANLHDEFKAATAAQGKNMTDVLLEFITQYVSQHGVAPKKKQGRR